MGSETAETPEVSTEQKTVDIEPVESEKQVEASEVSEGEEQQESVEVEAVLQGASGSQPDKQHEIDRIVKRKVRKLNAKNAKTEEKATQAEEALTIERQKTQLLQMALEQKTPAELPIPPDPADYDDGVRDPKYVRAFNEYNQPIIQAEVQRQTANLTPVQQETIDPDLEHKQTKHYERVNKLGAKDFDEREDRAIEILGKETVNRVISDFPESELILYYLGTPRNQGEAEEIAELLRNNSGIVKGVAELGRLSFKLSERMKGRTESVPDPDEEIEGGSPSAATLTKYEREEKKALEKAERTGSMDDLIDLARKRRDAGH